MSDIREGLAKRIYEWHSRNSLLNDVGEWAEVRGSTRGLILEITDICLEFLHENGVVRKVEGELPNTDGCIRPSDYRDKAAEAGFDVLITEPLIEVKDESIHNPA